MVNTVLNIGPNSRIGSYTAGRSMWQMKTEGILWGWAHCVLQYDITQAAIDRRLTLITCEGMNDQSESSAVYNILALAYDASTRPVRL